MQDKHLPHIRKDFGFSVGVILLVVLILSSVGLHLLLSAGGYGGPKLPRVVKVELPSPDLHEQQEEKVTEIAGMLVEGVPEFPTYQGAQVKKSYKKDLGQKTNYVVVWTANGAVPQAMAWYAKELKKSGWQVEGPDFPEAADEQQLTATNNQYTVKLIVGLEDHAETGQEYLNIMAEFLHQ